MPSKFGGAEEADNSSFGGQAETPDRLSQVISGEAEPEAADYLNALWEGMKGGGELALMGLTGAAAVPASGMAGIAKSITSGTEAGAETIQHVQEGLTYQPRSKALGEALGYTAQAAAEIPGMVPAARMAGKVMRTPQAIGDISYNTMIDLGFPPNVAAYYGAAGKSAIPSLIEIAGLKGTKVAKEGLLRKLVRPERQAEFYDEAGKLIPEVKQALKDSGIDMAAIDDVLPESIVTPKATQKPIEKIARAAGTRGQAGSIVGEIAAEVAPDPIVIEAAKEFGVLDDIPQSWLSTNRTYQAIEQGLKSVPASEIAYTEATAIKKLAQEADKLIEEFGGTTQKSNLNDQFRLDSINKIDELGAEADALYKKAKEMIDETMPVSAPETLSVLEEMASKKVVGGDIEIGKKRLRSPLARRLLTEFQREDITYDYLDSLRRDVGDALNKRQGPLKDESRGLLKKLYATMTKDQEAAIPDLDALAVYKQGKNLTFQRKVLEDQLQKVLGKDLTGDISQTAKTAILSLQEGRTKEWDRLAANLPPGLGKDLRRKVFSSALNNVMTQGSRAQRELNMAGFDDFMTGLKRNSSNYARLRREIGETEMARLSRFHDLIHAGRTAKGMEITTGRALAVPRVMDEITTLAGRLYGVTKPIEKVPGGTTTQNIIGAILNVKPTPRSELADRMLSSRRFKNLVLRKAQGQIKTPTAENNLNKLINQMGEYQRWKKTLSDNELSELAAVGAIGFLTGRVEPQEEPAP